jgi:Rrf2 family transcriptional regulator, iron-sulfur cluster assembly transcription factor
MVTNRSRFALTAMIHLADMTVTGPVSLPALSAREDISKSYLEQLFGLLRRRGLVQSRRGPGGGYLLGRDAAQISVADVLMAIDVGDAAGAGDDTLDGHGGEISQQGREFLDDRWGEVNRKLFECMATVSIASLAEDLPRAPAPEEALMEFKRGFLPRPVLVPVRPRGPNSVFALGHAASRQASEADAGQAPEAPLPRRANGVRCG